MPLEFDPLWRLSNPAWALAIGLPLIAIVAFLAYLPACRSSDSERSRYMRVLALVSEVLVSVGIIGLITFAARAMIDADIRRNDAESQEAQRQVNVSVWDFARQQCLDEKQSAGSSRIELEMITKACNWWPKLITSPNQFVDWWSARDEFAELAKRPAVRPELSSAYARIATDIGILIRLQDGLARNRHKKGVLEAEVSWGFVAVSTLLAAIGIAFKWARAFLDLTRRSG
jgi:hypothetical protein